MGPELWMVVGWRQRVVMGDVWYCGVWGVVGGVERGKDEWV